MERDRERESMQDRLTSLKPPSSRIRKRHYSNFCKVALREMPCVGRATVDIEPSFYLCNPSVVVKEKASWNAARKGQDRPSLYRTTSSIWSSFLVTVDRSVLNDTSSSNTISWAIMTRMELVHCNYKSRVKIIFYKGCNILLRRLRDVLL